MDNPTEKKEVVMERRVGSTVIRRRAKTTEPAVLPPSAADATTAKAVEGVSAREMPARKAPVSKTPVDKPVAPPKTQEVLRRVKAPAEPLVRVIKDEEKKKAEEGTLPQGALPPPPLTAREELEEKLRKARGKRKSKAEMELEDIRRAGGLRQYAEKLFEPTAESTEEVETPVAVVAEPEPDRVFEPTPGMRRTKKVRREAQKTKITAPKAIKKVIKIDQGIPVSQLSQAMGIKTADLIKKLMGLGQMATVNQIVDVDTATLLATDYGYEIQHVAFKEEAVLAKPKEKKGAAAGTTRAPVVTVMGHVDHGKTSLLDFIRKASVAEGEAGGITQHIGAYEVTIPAAGSSSRPHTITFIDTPGHEAFTHMRARGAKVTDIVILVVAADDGVMPQTIEAINHAKAAGVPMVVAMNKADKPQANLDRVKKQLNEQGLIPEDWGGDVICVPTSAKTGAGIDHLLEMLALVAEMKELRTDPKARAQGVVIESRLDRGQGPLATLIVQEGTLYRGDFVVCGSTYGKVRALVSYDGKTVEEAGPSKPVVVLGLNDVPEAGEALTVVADERAARQVVESRMLKKKSGEMGKTATTSLEELQKQISSAGVKDFAVVLKTDVIGSMEALRDAMQKLSGEKVTVHILHTNVGGITESDIMLAAASSAVVVGFNVTADAKARKLAEQEGVPIRIYSIIYEALDDLKKAMEGLLSPIEKEEILGHARVQQIFKVSKVGTVAGCLVTDGLVRRNAFARLTREGTVVYKGKIGSLKRFKDDAREVSNGQECGLSIDNFNDIKTGDVFEVFIIAKTAQLLDA